MDIRRDIN
jgi:hypothetical protein